MPAADRPVEVRIEGGHWLGEPGVAERLLVLVHGEVAVNDLGAALARDLLGQLGHREGVVAAELVGLTVVPLAGEDGGGGLGVVGACGRADAAVAGAAENGPVR